MNVARMEDMRNLCKILVGMSEGRSPLGRPRRRCDDNIRMDLRERRFEYVDWVHLAQEGTGS
jgi:hypothetical protein